MTVSASVPAWRLWLTMFGPNTVALVLLWPLFGRVAGMKKFHAQKIEVR